VPNQHATWHSLRLPRVIIVLPRHCTDRHVSSSCAATSLYGIHVSTVRSATCRLLVGPRQLYGLPRVASTMYHLHLPRVLYGLPRQLYGLTRVCTDCTDRYSQLPKFACLAFRTERDIFLIRTPFAIKIIPPDSGRRDGRNGTGFV
jgi:hypothetical protein